MSSARAEWIWRLVFAVFGGLVGLALASYFPSVDNTGSWIFLAFSAFAINITLLPPGRLVGKAFFVFGEMAVSAVIILFSGGGSAAALITVTIVLGTSLLGAGLRLLSNPFLKKYFSLFARNRR